MKLYAMKDLKAGQFGAVMLAQNDAHMARTILETFRGSGHTVEKFAGDFDLYQVAEYDGSTGETDRSVRYVCSIQMILQPEANGGPA